MASAIDATLPVQGNPTTASVRSNFAAAKAEIEALQATAGVGPQGPIGNTGPSGTLTVGTVTTGAAGSNATVTNSGTTQAAVLNFTIPRGDSGTGGGGITETQAKDAVRQGNVRFEELSPTEAAAWATTPNLASAPVVGANWTPATGGTATQAYTHDMGSTEGLAYPATISNGSYYQIVFNMSNVTGTSTITNSFFTLYFRTAPTTTTGQQLVLASVTAGSTLVIQATGNFSHFVVIPVSGWQGTFTLTRIVVGGTQNSVTFSVKNWETRARGNARFDGGGGHFATNATNTAFGFNALNVLTTGSNNVAIGESAAASGTTGSSNVAVGYQALQIAMTASNNVAIGSQALQQAQTASNNTAIGQQALGANRIGANNTAVGQAALIEHRVGDHNVAIGSYALRNYNATLANNNIAIGQQTLWAVSGHHNIALGYFALSSGGPPANFTGTDNIAIGNLAGGYGSSVFGITSADRSIFLGPTTRAAGAGQINQIMIGADVTGHGSNTITLGNDEITALHCNVQTISALSDSRVKENIQPANLDMCLNAVRNLPVSEWDWLPIAGVHKDKHDIGFVSDDVAKVFPKAITKEDRFLTVRDADGKPEMTSVTEAVWQPPNQEPDATAPRTQTRQIEKTMEIKGLQYVSTSEILPTLWGAVQKLIEKNDELEKRLAELQPSPSEQPKSAAVEPSKLAAKKK